MVAISRAVLASIRRPASAAIFAPSERLALRMRNAITRLTGTVPTPDFSRRYAVSASLSLIVVMDPIALARLIEADGLQRSHQLCTKVDLKAWVIIAHPGCGFAIHDRAEIAHRANHLEILAVVVQLSIAGHRPCSSSRCSVRLRSATPPACKKALRSVLTRCLVIRDRLGCDLHWNLQLLGGPARLGGAARRPHSACMSPAASAFVASSAPLLRLRLRRRPILSRARTFVAATRSVVRSTPSFSQVERLSRPSQ